MAVMTVILLMATNIILLPSALAQSPSNSADLQAETVPRPMILGYETVLGVCDGSGPIYSGAEGTLKKCSKTCMQDANCYGINVLTDRNLCMLIRGAHCESTHMPGPSEPTQNYYAKGKCTTSTVGDEYYVAFMANTADTKTQTPLEIWMTQTVKQNTNVSVKLEVDPSQTLDFTSSAQVSFEKLFVVKVPVGWRLSDQYNQSYVSIEKKAIKVSSPGNDFVLYGVNKDMFSADAFVGLPTKALGKRYIAACHWPPGKLTCEFAVTPVEADTTVTITLPKTGATMNDQDPDASAATTTLVCAVPFNGKTYSNGDSFQIKLQPFEVAQIADACDLTGTLIEADKKIAVWSGDSRSWVNDVRPPGTTLYNRDHLVESLFPTDKWGYSCAGWATPNRTAGFVDHWVLTAAEDGTVITIQMSGSNSFLPGQVTLNKGQSYRFKSDSVQTLYYFSSDKRFQAVVTCSSTSSPDIHGDPSSTVCIPSDQFGYGYVFVTPQGVSSHYDNFLTIVASSDLSTGFLLNGHPITPAFAPIPGGEKALMAGSLQLDGTLSQFKVSHVNPFARFAAYIYGAGDRESIAYPAGSCIDAIPAPNEKVTKMVIADGVDNDCDGVIDEELLDGIDNDLDGLIDEDCYAGKKTTCDCPKYCPDIPAIDGGYYSAVTFRVGGQVTFFCHKGHTLRGAKTITCNADGTWSDAVPTCEEAACPCCESDADL